jgi:hypothetical protein
MRHGNNWPGKSKGPTLMNRGRVTGRMGFDFTHDG